MTSVIPARKPGFQPRVGPQPPWALSLLAAIDALNVQPLQVTPNCNPPPTQDLCDVRLSHSWLEHHCGFSTQIDSNATVGLNMLIVHAHILTAAEPALSLPPKRIKLRGIPDQVLPYQRLQVNYMSYLCVQSNLGRRRADMHHTWMSETSVQE